MLFQQNIVIMGAADFYFRIYKGQVTTKHGHHNRLAEIGMRTQQSVQTLIAFYLLNKMLRCVGIIILVEFSIYLESFSMI